MESPVRDRMHRLLRWSERYTKVDMLYFASGGFWLSAGSVMGAALSFLVALIFANFLDPEIYGSYKYILSIAGILGISVLPGIDTALVRAVSRGKEGTVTVVMKTRVLWGLLGTAAGVALTIYYWLHGNASLGAGFLVVALFIAIMDPLTSYDDLLQGRSDFRRSSLFGFAIQIGVSLLMAGSVLAFHALVPLLLAYFAGYTFLRLIALVYTFKEHPPNRERDDTAIGYGKHLTFLKGVSTVASSLGSIVLFHTLGGTGLAIYSIALAPIEQARGLLNSVGSLVLPKFSKDSWTVPSPAILAHKTRAFFAVLTLGIICYIGAAPYVFRLLFPRYVASVPYSQVLALSLLLTIAGVILTSILRAKKEVRKIYAFSVTSITTTLILTGPMTYLWGVWGLIASQFTVKIVETATLWYLIFLQ
jgi:O-antigen/teichoic acid export membrane protein